MRVLDDHKINACKITRDGIEVHLVEQGCLALIPRQQQRPMVRERNKDQKDVEKKRKKRKKKREEAK